MKIDAGIEPLVRTVLNAVVKQDTERLQTALEAFPDADAMTSGYRLAAGIAIYVLQDQYGRQPTPEEIRAVADKTAELENWTDITSDEIYSYVTAYYDRQSVDTVMPTERAVVVSYVLAGDLLAACHRQDEKWWDYLDRAEAILEQARYT